MNKLGLTVLLKIAQDVVVPAIITAIKEKEGKEVVNLTAFHPHGGTQAMEDVEEGEGTDQWQMPGQVAHLVGQESQLDKPQPAASKYPLPKGDKEQQ